MTTTHIRSLETSQASVFRFLLSSALEARLRGFRVPGRGGGGVRVTGEEKSGIMVSTGRTEAFRKQKEATARQGLGNIAILTIIIIVTIIPGIIMISLLFLL